MSRLPILAAVLSLLSTAPALAQSGGVFEITRSTIDAGGETDRPAGALWLRGTVGQPDLGVSTRGELYLSGGFWATGGRTGPIFFDGFETGDTALWSVTFVKAPAPPSQPPAQAAPPPADPPSGDPGVGGP